MPEGKTKFEFDDAGPELVEIGYDWLVITGAPARYQGTGELQDRPGTFGFSVTAIDGDFDPGDGYPEDAFGIRIWSTSSGEVIYDTALTGSAALPPSNGKIKIKTGGGNSRQ